MRTLLSLALLALLWALPAFGDEAWEQEVDRQRMAQDRQFAAAAQGAKDTKAAVAPLVQKFEQAAARNRTPVNVYLLGRAYFYGGRADDSERAMRETLQLEPGFWFAHRSLARLKMAKNDFVKAEEHIQLVLRRRPGDAGEQGETLGNADLPGITPAEVLQ